jgi:hypothetical protein
VGAKKLSDELHGFSPIPDESLQRVAGHPGLIFPVRAGPGHPAPSALVKADDLADGERVFPGCSDTVQADVLAKTFGAMSAAKSSPDGFSMRMARRLPLLAHAPDRQACPSVMTLRRERCDGPSRFPVEEGLRVAWHAQFG